MPILITCSGCKKRLRVGDKLAGRRLPCPNCGDTVAIPANEEEVADLLLQDDPAPLPSPSPPEIADSEEAPRLPVEEPELKRRTDSVPSLPRPPAKRPRIKQQMDSVSTLPPLKADEIPTWLRHLHWL